MTTDELCNATDCNLYNKLSFITKLTKRRLPVWFFHNKSSVTSDLVWPLMLEVQLISDQFNLSVTLLFIIHCPCREKSVECNNLKEIIQTFLKIVVGIANVSYEAKWLLLAGRSDEDHFLFSIR